MDKYTIIQMDCLEAMQTLEPESVDLVFADPPYWMRTSGVLKRVEGTDYNGCNDRWDNTFNSFEVPPAVNSVRAVLTPRSSAEQKPPNYWKQRQGILQPVGSYKRKPANARLSFNQS